MKTTEKQNWVQQKALLKSRYPYLTDKDLEFEEGKKEEMLARVATKVGVPKSELAASINEI